MKPLLGLVFFKKVGMQKVKVEIKATNEENWEPSVRRYQNKDIATHSSKQLFTFRILCISYEWKWFLEDSFPRLNGTGNDKGQVKIFETSHRKSEKSSANTGRCESKFGNSVKRAWLWTREKQMRFERGEWEWEWETEPTDVFGNRQRERARRRVCLDGGGTGRKDCNTPPRLPVQVGVRRVESQIFWNRDFLRLFITLQLPAEVFDCLVQTSNHWNLYKGRE